MTASADSAGAKWWKSAVVFQIYPSSYLDTTGNGLGDLPGILSKLDYIAGLGVDAVWISPFFQSPNKDYGYDISDYQKPDDRYGTLEDVEAIIQGCHDRGMKILFDLVISHTSDQHAWFKDAEKSKDSPYRDFYIWRPARYTQAGERIPPTNWRAIFGGSTWEWSEPTDSYYYHTFLKEQPDLNWETEAVRDAIFENAITFWLKKGVDGFRVDATTFYSKHPFEDVPLVDANTFDQPSEKVMHHGPRLGEFVQDVVSKTFARFDAVTIAESGGDLSVERMLEQVAAKENKYSMAIGFDVLGLDHDPEFPYYYRPWTLDQFKTKTELSQQLADPKHDAWECNYLENHDHGRSIGRFADDSPEYRGISAKLLSIYLVTLSGTLLLYQGQEIGMVNLPKEWPLAEYIDPATQMYWKNIQAGIARGDGQYNAETAWKGVQTITRDHSRTPMQWTAGRNAGFSTGDKTWMRVHDNYPGLNVAKQEGDEGSVLSFWKKALALRKKHADTFIFGLFELLPTNDKTMAYVKTNPSDAAQKVLVVLNFSGEEQSVEVPAGLKEGAGKEVLLLGNYDDQKRGIGSALRPWEGRVYGFQAR